MITLYKDRTRKSYTVSTSRKELGTDALQRFKDKICIIVPCWVKDDFLFLEKPESFDQRAYACFSSNIENTNSIHMKNYCGISPFIKLRELLMHKYGTKACFIVPCSSNYREFILYSMRGAKRCKIQ